MNFDLLGASAPHPEDQTYSDKHRDRPLCLEWDFDPSYVNNLVSLPDFKGAKANFTAAAIMYDALVAVNRNHDIRTSYSRNNNHFVSRYIPDGMLPRAIPDIIDRLVAEKLLVDHDRKKPSSRPTGEQSSYLPAPWLKDVQFKRPRRKVLELIKLRDKHGKNVDYQDTKRTDYERRFLVKFNGVVADADIELKSPNAIDDDGVIRFENHCVHKDSIELYRVYNQAWTLGGRFYGGYWQGVSKEDRKFFYIDGEKVHEEDYPQTHPAMLYHIAGVEKNGDAYDIPGWNRPNTNDRDLCKKVFNILINARNWPSCHGAVKNAMVEFGYDPSGAKDFINDVKAHHPGIANFFYSNEGLKLMSLDSTICRNILTDLSINKGIVCLPVHDSFIVREQYRDELALAMKRAWDDVLSRAKK